jgi:hypothetical protein
LNVTCNSRCSLDDFLNTYETRIADRDSFKLGYKRCRKCEIYIKYDGHRCPCCQNRLASGPKNAKSKRLLNESIGIKRH